MAIIVSTSGTTGGRSKHVELSEDVLQARVDLTPLAKGKNIADCRVIYSAKAESSSSYQRFKAWCEQNNKILVSAVPPNKILDTFKKLRVDAIDAAPGYLVMVAKLYEKSGKPANLKQVISGHSSMDRVDAVFVQKWLSKDLQIGYGCTEIGTVATGSAEEVADIPGCVGRVLPGIEVEIVNGGDIRIKSPDTMVSEYVNNPEMTVKHFIDGWFYPGDKGYFTQDGRLVITSKR